MDTRELNKLASTLVETIMSLHLTRAEVCMLQGVVNARINSIIATRETTSTTSETSPEVPITSRSEAPKPKVKQVPYDPIFDPPPAMEVERLPEQPQSTSKLMIPKNSACICNSCKKVIYITARDIVDGMKVGEFIDSFEPVEGAPKMTRTTELQNIDGVITIDCPVCGALKKLYLTGGPRV